MMDGICRSSARTTIITGDQNNLCARLCNTSSNRADTSFGYKLYGDTCICICIFTIIDQLCQILDRIDIVMWRW